MPTRKERLPIYLSEELKEEIKAEADSDSRNMSNYIIYILERRNQIEEIKVIQKRLEKAGD